MNFPLGRIIITAPLVATSGCVLTEPVGSASDPTADAGSCNGEPAEEFTWQWDFGAHEPGLEEYADEYTYDAASVLDCTPAGYVDDPEADTLNLDLDCEVEGVPIED